MANPQKNKDTILNLCAAIDSVENGKFVDNFENHVRRAFYIFSNGYKGETICGSDSARSSVIQLREYGKLIAKRNEVDIAGGARQIATEEDALQALHLIYGLTKNLIVPHFKTQTEFSNKAFNEMYNLGFSYVEGIVNGTAEGYIDESDAIIAKVNAIELAKEGVKLKEIYDTKNLSSEELKSRLRGFGQKLDRTRPKMMRSFENVSTSAKKIHKKEDLIKKLEKEITELDKNGKLKFYTPFIFPVAHGGTELGVILSNALDDIGIKSTTYPLMFSMKTRKQKEPQVRYDEPFFREYPLEGTNVLVTEDWVTTGNTVRGILAQLEQRFPREIRVATIKRDPEKSDVPLLNKYTFYTGELSRYLGTKTDSLKDMKDDYPKLF